VNRRGEPGAQGAWSAGSRAERIDNRGQPSTQSYAVPSRSEDDFAWLDDKCWDKSYAGLLAPVE